MKITSSIWSKRLLTHFRMSNISLIAASLCLVGHTAFAQTYTFTTLDDPLAAPSQTFVRGISGGTVVGFYGDGFSFPHGFMYSGGVYTTLDDPLATTGTLPTAVDGNTVVGFYDDAAGTHGFVETSGIFTTVDNPSAIGNTAIYGVSGNTLLGTYNGHGFSETAGMFTTLDYPAPLLESCIVTGISGNIVVGYWTASLGYLNGGSSDYTYGFYEAGGVYTRVSVPGSLSGTTVVNGISSNGTLVGTFGDAVGAHGFIETGGVFITIDDPDAVPGTTSIFGISGNTISGTYLGADGSHGFIAVLPEPAGLLPITTGILALLNKRRRR
ncbi:MAG TPA: hypothetical protein VFE58_15680 [Tepidisphaeraceae bacterium]|nr:hypothetical protein [Tepidisphaeraceae bacterium]